MICLHLELRSLLWSEQLLAQLHVHESPALFLNALGPGIDTAASNRRRAKEHSRRRQGKRKRETEEDKKKDEERKAGKEKTQSRRQEHGELVSGPLQNLIDWNNLQVASCQGF